jgi:hypothetical protein
MSLLIWPFDPPAVGSARLGARQALTQVLLVGETAGKKQARRLIGAVEIAVPGRLAADRAAGGPIRSACGEMTMSQGRSSAMAAATGRSKARE